jgi:hypothetical protein
MGRLICICVAREGGTMRKLMSGFGAGVLLVGTLAFLVTPLGAADTKPCWAHQDTDPASPTFGGYAAVWALGGGHVKHETAGTDVNLGTFDSYAACSAAFTGAGY